MGPAKRRTQPIEGFVSNGFLHNQDIPWVDARSRLLKYQSECLVQAPDVFLDRGSGDSAREGNAPAGVLRMILTKLIGANSQLNLARTLSEARMPR